MRLAQQVSSVLIWVSREEPLDPSTGEKETHVESATASTKASPLKIEWLRLVCHECINTKHLVKHRELCRVDYKGSAGGLVCSQRACRKWVSSLWHAQFVRSEDCSHSDSNNVIPTPKATASRLVVLLPNRKSLRLKPKADSEHSKRKLSKIARRQGVPAGSADGKFLGRVQQHGHTGMANNIAKPTESIATQNMQGGVLEQVCQNPL